MTVAVIGAGPVGLAAAAHLTERDIPYVVLEAGDGPGATIAQWSHVRVFSPWRYNTDAAAVRLLEAKGWQAPDPDGLPTGAELIEHYLLPLSELLTVRYSALVSAVTRQGFDRVRTAGRENAAFLIRLSDGQEITASAVIDASGTWETPNVLGASGIPAIGEAEAAKHILSALPDVLGSDRHRFAGRHTVVVGAGHSAATTLLSLAELDEATITWAIRSGEPGRSYGGGEADALPARGRLGSRLRSHVESGRINLAPGFFINRITVRGDEVELFSNDGRSIQAHLVVNATGFRPDLAITSELRLDLDPILGSTRALAPLIDPNKHSCGTVPPHGVDELAHPEPDFYTIGVKSYGRAPTFLLATGYEQARSVVAALAGDWTAARDVRLELPETGVCSGGGGQGLVTGASGGLLPLAQVSSGCCG